MLLSMAALQLSAPSQRLQAYSPGIGGSRVSQCTGCGVPSCSDLAGTPLAANCHDLNCDQYAGMVVSDPAPVSVFYQCARCERLNYLGVRFEPPANCIPPGGEQTSATAAGCTDPNDPNCSDGSSQSAGGVTCDADGSCSTTVACDTTGSCMTTIACDATGSCTSQLVSTAANSPYDLSTICGQLGEQLYELISVQMNEQQLLQRLQQQEQDLKTRLANLSYYAQYGTTLPGPDAAATQAQLASVQQQEQVAQYILNYVQQQFSQVLSQYHANACGIYTYPSS
jgi:hypothetical protein